VKKVLKEGFFEVAMENSASPDILNHLNNTVLGTPGRIRYQFSGITEKLSFIKECYYITLRKGDNLLGTIGFVRRLTLNQGKAYNSWYIRYFSIKAPLRAKKQKDAPRKKRQSSHMDNIFKSLPAGYFDNPNLFLGETSPVPGTLIYATVEKDNIRSQQFTGIVGFESAREFCSVSYSRTRLKMHDNITRINEIEKPAILEVLRSFYKDHTLFTTDNIFYNNNYFVYRDGREIIAGLQANPETWRIVEMPGLNGWLLLNILPVVPGISSFYNPEAFRFIGVEGFFYKEGYEDRIIPLIETAMAIHNAHFALTWLDTGSPVFHMLETLGNYGNLTRFISRVPADTKIKFIGYTEEEKKIFYNSPAYFSCFDMT